MFFFFLEKNTAQTAAKKSKKESVDIVLQVETKKAQMLEKFDLRSTCKVRKLDRNTKMMNQEKRIRRERKNMLCSKTY